MSPDLRPRIYVGAMVALAVLLAVIAPRCGYHPNASRGYTDQPPLTPLLAQAAISVFGTRLVALRIVSLLCAVASLPILVLITRRWSVAESMPQALTAWGMAGATLTLMFGHVLLTASIDLVVWPAVLLFVIRVVLREDGRWLIAAGALVGLSALNKLLTAVLLIAIAIGLAIARPRRWFRSGRLWAAVSSAAFSRCQASSIRCSMTGRN